MTLCLKLGKIQIDVHLKCDLKDKFSLWNHCTFYPLTMNVIAQVLLKEISSQIKNHSVCCKRKPPDVHNSIEFRETPLHSLFDLSLTSRSHQPGVIHSTLELQRKTFSVTHCWSSVSNYFCCLNPIKF